MFGCILCNKQFEDPIDWLNHIDDEHPEVAEKIKQKWREEGFIK